MAREDRHLLEFRRAKLAEDEEIIGHMRADTDMGVFGTFGRFLVTNKRVCFYSKKMVGEVFETIPLSKITSIETKQGMTRRKLTLHTSHNELKVETSVGDTSKDAFKKICNQIEMMRSIEPEREARTDFPAIPAERSVVEQLNQLSQMKAAGDLTEDEFTALKAQLLAKNAV